MLKHSSGVNLEDLDFEEVDKEMEADEIAQVATTTLEENALEGMIVNLRMLLSALVVVMRLLFKYSHVNHSFFFLFFSLLVVPSVFLGFKY